MLGLLRGAWDGSPGAPSVVTHGLKSHTVLSTDRATTRTPWCPVREESRAELTVSGSGGPGGMGGRVTWARESGAGPALSPSGTGGQTHLGRESRELDRKASGGVLYFSLPVGAAS